MVNQDEINWQVVPEKLQVLKEPVAGIEPKLAMLRYPYYPQQALEREQAIEEIRQHLQGIWTEEIAEEIRRFGRDPASLKPSVRRSAGILGMLLVCIFPESSHLSLSTSLDILASLPADVRRVAATMRLMSEHDVAERSERLTQTEKIELKKLKELMLSNEVALVVDDILRKYPIDKFTESAWLYFLTMLLDESVN